MMNGVDIRGKGVVLKNTGCGFVQERQDTNRAKVLKL
jgi:hypothetical protein